jgi:hypothetical protein
MTFKIYRSGQSLSWNIRGRSGDLGKFDHIVARDVVFKTRKRDGSGYAESSDTTVVADTRLLDGRIVMRDGVWVFDATGKVINETLPLVVFNRLGAFIHAGSVTHKRG